MYQDKRYTVRFPKRSFIKDLLCNLNLEIQRLDRKVIGLSKNPARYQSYKEELLRFVEDGYAIEITSEDLSNEGLHAAPRGHQFIRRVANRFRLLCQRIWLHLIKRPLAAGPEPPP